MDTAELIPIEAISQRIFVIRGVKVMLDADLAELYGIRTMRLNQAVKRNFNRFPDDFMFRLSGEEARELNLSQNVIGSENSFDRYQPQFATGSSENSDISQNVIGSENGLGNDRLKFTDGSENGIDKDGIVEGRSQLVIGPESASNLSQFAIGSEMSLYPLYRSQFITGFQKHRNLRFLPYAFTEHGVAMLSTVLRSERAAEMSVYIIRAFIISSTSYLTN
ncbi:MAG: ORF6N domain-containing protein [Candidatus Pacebacteria bacterium]|nr:ORF6N domain-containing protein [Candidatus Paceibacterota bacterium]